MANVAVTVPDEIAVASALGRKMGGLLEVWGVVPATVFNVDIPIPFDTSIGVFSAPPTMLGYVGNPSSLSGAASIIQRGAANTTAAGALDILNNSLALLNAHYHAIGPVV